VTDDIDRILLERKRTAAFAFNVDGKTQKAHASWYRGQHCNYNPTKENFLNPRAIEDYILKGWMPPTPFITKQHNITAFGSCFASHISSYLINQNYRVLTSGNANAYIIRCGEGLVNTYALLQQFEWAFENKKFSQNLWHGYDTGEHGYDEAVRQATLGIFQQTDLFIVTIGLSEVWYDKLTGEVFWRAIPVKKFDESRHGFRVATHEENRRNIARIYDIVRANRPSAHILFTLSPIPLVATFRPVGCISANSVSKATLRSALDEVMRAHSDDANLHYFPSYEIVTNAFLDPFSSDRRHVREEVLDFVMAGFDRFFCVGNIAEKTEHYYKHLSTALAATQ